MRSNNEMKIEKIVNDTRDIASSLYAAEVLGAWEPCALIADLVGETGTLAHSVLTIEGIAAAPPEIVHLESHIPRFLFMLANLSNVYGVDLEQAWSDLIQEGWSNIARLESEIAEK